MPSPATTLTQAELKTAIIRNPLVVTPDTSVIEAIAQMSGIRSVCSVFQTPDKTLESSLIEARSSCVLVVKNNQFVGIFTERDVVRLSAQKRDLENLAIGDVMAHPVVTLRESEFTDVFLRLICCNTIIFVIYQWLTNKINWWECSLTKVYGKNHDQ